MNQESIPQRFIYFFGDGQAEGGSAVKHLVGGKGASLADMTNARLNVPPGFTLSAECCDLYYKAGKQWPAGLKEEVRTNLARLEELAGRPFGQGGDPLLVAVRSGAAQSMPGMMDTVLNVGLNPDCVRDVAERTGNHRGAWEAYRHFLAMFGHTVGGIEEAAFTSVSAELLREAGKSSEADLDGEQLEELCNRFRSAYRRHTGRDVPTQPWDLLCQAINAVFGSWNNERAVAYRRHHGIEGLLGTAVNVQRMCPAEVSGVMFTANPVNPGLEQVLIESSYGLGEAVVLGKVTPDRFVLDKRDLKVIERAISMKDHVISTFTQAACGLAPDAASLSDPQIAELARLGLRVEAYFQHPCDIEWALSQGQFYLLQARAIKGIQAERSVGLTSTTHHSPLTTHHSPLTTHHSPGEREQVRREEIAALAARAEPDGTIWSRFNLAEILPEPTPMTWAIVRRFMSGKGGFGLMYRDLGFDPDPALDDEGIFDLVCGRPYCNLSRQLRLQFRQPPFEYPFAAFKAAPHKAIYPQPVPNPARAGARFWLLLPWISLRLWWRLRGLHRNLARRLREELLPAFAAETAQEAVRDLAALDTPALLQRLEYWIQRTLYVFARDSLKPTALAGMAQESLERKLGQLLGRERTQAALGELVMGVHPDPEADLPGALRDLAAGRLDRAAFRERFGHRGSQEMELAQPRWAEDPAAFDRLAAQVSGQHAETAKADYTASLDRIAVEAKLTPAQRSALENDLRTLHTYLGLRETGKHYLMRGYALIRRLLVELDRRHHLDGGIFYLTPEELPRLAVGEDLSALIAQRRRRRELALSLEVPQVLFSDDLEAIGRPSSPLGGEGPRVRGADVLQGVPLSAGVAEGPALVLHEPSGAEPDQAGYILVCPSTDPAWVPLFVHAKGLIMETGGVLSHGAIVAREFGLPAVAGLPDVHRRLKSGQRLRIDGSTGTVTALPTEPRP